MIVLPDFEKAVWTDVEKWLFRFLFVLAMLLSVPLDWRYVLAVHDIDWANFGFTDIFYIARYTPRFWTGNYPQDPWGLFRWQDCVFVSLIAFAGSLIWTFLDKDRSGYRQLYAWMRILLRYRLAAAVWAYGFIKFFPLQAPAPSLSELNLAYGDFSAWELFSLTLGIVPGYQSALGFFEILAGLLLLCRKTATFGAVIVFIFTGNVFVSNLAYGGPEVLYSLYLVSIALVLLSHDAVRIHRVAALRIPTSPASQPVLWTASWQKQCRLFAKALFAVFFFAGYGFKTASAYYEKRNDTTSGHADFTGVYKVRDFRTNRVVASRSQLNLARSQDVILEPSATPTVGFDAFVESVLVSNSALKHTTGSRHHYRYEADTVRQLLFIHNQTDSLTFRYKEIDPNTLSLAGADENRDSVFVTLEKTRKAYLLQKASARRDGVLKL